MAVRHLLPALALLGLPGVVGAEDVTQRYARAQAAIGAAVSGKEVSVRASAEGDLNGDGITDFVAVVKHRPIDGLWQEWLVVLTGTAEKEYKLLSMSGRFCGAGKFYELSIDATSLFVRGVWRAEPERSNDYTMQFRYSQGLNDLELVGEEVTSYEEGQNYRVSVNYLSKSIIHTREAGKRRKDVKARLVNPAVLRLQGFECSASESMKPNVYIDENFKVHRP